jgi:hypothetical protein
MSRDKVSKKLAIYPLIGYIGDPFSDESQTSPDDMFAAQNRQKKKTKRDLRAVIQWIPMA